MHHAAAELIEGQADEHKPAGGDFPPFRSDRFFDLAEESIDVALRVVDEAPMNVDARRLC